MTFIQKLEVHAGGLIKISGHVYTTNDESLLSLHGKTGMLLESFTALSHDRIDFARVTFLIDGKVRTELLYEEEVQFL